MPTEVNAAETGRKPAAARATIYWVATAFLLALGLAYAINGTLTLIAPGYEGDLGTRWRERDYLRRGIDPYDVSVQFKGMTADARELKRIALQGLGHEPAIDPSGYPPWGLAASFLLVPPGPPHLVHVMFAGLCLAALGVTAIFAFKLAMPWGRAPAMLIAASVIAMFGNASTLRLGQYGMILNAFLFVSLWASTKQRRITSGLSMAIAAIKPNYSAFQIMLMPARRQWVALACVALLCASASVVPWLLTGVNPIELVQQMLHQSRYVSEGDTSLLRIARLIMPYSLAMPGLGLAGLTATLWLGWKYRDASPMVATSAAAVIGRLCLYHRQYDNVMLVFPLVSLGLIALAYRQPWTWMVFAMYGATLWAPIPYRAYQPPVIAALSLAWLAGLVMICRHAGQLPARTFIFEPPA